MQRKHRCDDVMIFYYTIFNHWAMHEPYFHFLERISWLHNVWQSRYAYEQHSGLCWLVSWAEWPGSTTPLSKRQRDTSASGTLTEQSWPEDQHFHLSLHSDENALVTRRTLFQQSKCGDDFRVWWSTTQLLVDVSFVPGDTQESPGISRHCLNRNDFSFVWLSDHSCRLPHLQAKYKTEIIIQWVLLNSVSSVHNCLTSKIL